MRRIAGWLALVGVTLVLGALILGLMVPVSVDTRSGGAVECGAAWSPEYDDAIRESSRERMTTGENHDYRADCRSARTTRTAFALLAGVPGVLALVGSVVLVTRRRVAVT